MGFYGRKLFIVCNHPANFGGHRHYGSGDKMLLIYHMTSSDHVFKELYDFMGCRVSHHLARFTGHRPCGSSDIAVKRFYVILQDMEIKRPGNFIEENFSLYISTKFGSHRHYWYTIILLLLRDVAWPCDYTVMWLYG